MIRPGLDYDEQVILELFLETRERWTAKQRFMLGMAISALFLRPGETRTRDKLGAFANVSRQAIEHIELRGLRKCRRNSVLTTVAKEHLLK